MRNTSFIKVTYTSSVFSASVWALTPRCVWGCLREKERCVQSVLIPWALLTGFFDQNSSNQDIPSGTSGKKNPPANAGDIRDAGLIPGLGRSPRGGHGNPLQYSCLENPKDRGAWQAAVPGVSKSWTLSDLARTARMHQRLESEIKAWGRLLSIWLRWSLHIMHHFKV